MKSTGQAKYHLKKGQQMKSSIETPFNIGLGLYTSCISWQKVDRLSFRFEY